MTTSSSSSPVSEAASPDAGGEGVATPLSGSDILVEHIAPDARAGHEGAVPSEHSVEPQPAIVGGAAALSIEDVLQGTDSESGVCLSFETVGANTVVSISEHAGSTNIVMPIVTLEGVTDLTLQQLLELNQSPT